MKKRNTASKAVKAEPTRVTSHDVARAAGVSQSAVSRAFNSNGRIAPDTRKKVLRVAKSLGYFPNAFARTLARQTTSIVGVLMARLDNHFYPKVLEDFATQLREAGRQVMFFKVGDEGDVDETLQTALQYRVEAMVMTSITLSSQMVRTFAEAGIPVILFNRYLDSSEVHVVSCDNVAGGRLAADAFLDAQHRCFAFIGGSPNTSTNQDRKLGFMSQLKGRGTELAYALENDFSYEWGKSAASHLFGQPRPPDALFCASDLIALGALDAVRFDFGLCVPDDVAVIGFDDVPAASWAAYGLTTVRQPGDRMLAETLAIIVDKEERVTKRTTVPVALVERATTRPREPSKGAPLEEVEA